MKLLIVTQAVDTHDTTLGFFHRWIEEFSKRVEHVEVICLRKGEYDLPKNVEVHSLGKENGFSRATFVGRFFGLIFTLRNDYDVVFVHMNQEYIVLGGLLWALWGKKVFFWRNHPQGDFVTRIAGMLSHRVFYTSSASFTTRFGHAEMMPAGIDTEMFTQHHFSGKKSGAGFTNHEERKKNSLLMFGRIAPIKKIELAIDVLTQLKSKGIEAELSIIGDVLPKDEGYFQRLKDRIEIASVSSAVRFEKGVPFEQAPGIYQRHELFLNFTPSGSFDKTILEALSCGMKVVTSNESMKNMLPEGSLTNGKIEDVVKKIESLLLLDEKQSMEYDERAREIVRKQSLDFLMDKLLESVSK